MIVFCECAMPVSGTVEEILEHVELHAETRCGVLNCRHARCGYEPRLPAEPFAVALKQAAAATRGPGRQGGLRMLSRTFAARFGGKPESAARLFERVVHGHPTVTARVADRLTVFLELWGA